MNHEVGDIVSVTLAARLWDEKINETIGSFRRCDYGVIIEVEHRHPDYVKVFTTRGITGWVLKSLILVP